MLTRVKRLTKKYFYQNQLAKYKNDPKKLGCTMVSLTFKIIKSYHNCGRAQWIRASAMHAIDEVRFPSRVLPKDFLKNGIHSFFAWRSAIKEIV